MAKKAVARKDIKLSGTVYKAGEEIPNWRFVKKRTKQSLVNLGRVEEIEVEEVEVEEADDEDGDK